MNIGIDLGTTFCVTSYINKNGEVDFIPSADGKTTTASFIYFKEYYNKIKTIVGNRAKELMRTEPDNVVSSFKTYMGTSHVVKNVIGKNITSLECSTILLKHLKANAEKFLGECVTGAVISVPAYFTEKQKDATRLAAKYAGLDVLRILTEPTAGAYYYGITSETAKVVAVYDIGGGTFDVSVISLEDDTSVILGPPNGDTKLGGDNFDTAIAEHIVKVNKVKIKSKSAEMEKLIRLAEDAKIKLCEMITENGSKSVGNESVTISLTELNMPDFTLTRSLFEQLIDPFINRTLICLEEAIQDAGIEASDLDEIVLVGGSSRIPYIHQKLAEVYGQYGFNKKYFSSYCLDPDLAVGLGCGVYLDLIENHKESRVTDVTPHSIGTAFDDGTFQTIIKRGRTIPTKASRVYTNSNDFDDIIYIPIFEGDNIIANKNTYIGTIEVPVPKMPKGTLQVMVQVKVTNDGILDIHALSGATSVNKKLKIQRDFDISESWLNTLNTEEVEDSTGSTPSKVKGF